METFIVFGYEYDGEVLSGELDGDKAFIFPKDGVSDRDAYSGRKKVAWVNFPQFKVERYLSENGKTYLVAKSGNFDDIATRQKIESVILSNNPSPID